MAEGWADPSGAAIPAPMSLEESYGVIGIERRTATIAELWLRPRGGALEYLPGEYVLLEDRERRVSPRSFSIANAPRPDGLISLLVTRVPDGETSTWVHERLRVGEEVSVSGPYGTFVDDPTSTGPALFLAAGSGLAPIRALLEAAVAANTRSSLTLIFSARSEADVIDRDRFADLGVASRVVSLHPDVDPRRRPAAPRASPRAASAAVRRPLRSRCVHRGRARVRARVRGRCRRDWRAARARSHGGVLRRAAAVDRRDLAGGGWPVSAKPAGVAPPIYTKTGDDGTTGLLFGGRVSKADPVIEACGTLDEAVAALGLGRANLEDAGLQEIVLALQRGLFAAAAEIAANPRARDRLIPGISSVTAEMTAVARAGDRRAARRASVAPGVRRAGRQRRPRPHWTWPGHFCAARSDALVAAREGGMPAERLADRVREPRLGPRLRPGAAGRRR